jgi:purine-binding chemotaxis protein CheW
MTATNQSNQSLSGDEHECQFLTFLLADEEYGVDILRVQEIRGYDTVTSIPNTPEYVLGVLNLRGSIVPIIDLRLRFGLDRMAYGKTTVIVVVRVEDESGSRVMGMVVDGVSDVCNLSKESLKDAPKMGSNGGTQCISGLATIDEKMVILLDIDTLLTTEDVLEIPEAELQAAG